jgi:hypothetical protein
MFASLSLGAFTADNNPFIITKQLPAKQHHSATHQHSFLEPPVVAPQSD